MSEDLSELPATAATGHMKGLLILAAVKTLRSAPAEVKQTAPERLQRYLKERIAVTAWYPVIDCHLLVEFISQAVLRGMPESAGRSQALVDFSGARSPFLRDDLSILEGLRHLALSWPLNYDRGHCDIEPVSGGARLLIHDWAIPTDVMSRLMAGYCLGALETLRARTPRAEVVSRQTQSPSRVEIFLGWAPR